MPDKKITIYQTKTRIDNPIGDGRHNRAEWQSYLSKNFIPPGFVFGVDEDGNIHDRNVSSKVLEVKTGSDAEKLREALLDVATAPLEAVEVREPNPVEVMCKTLGITPDQLRVALNEAIGVTPNPSPAQRLDEVDVVGSGPTRRARTRREAEA